MHRYFHRIAHYITLVWPSEQGIRGAGLNTKRWESTARKMQNLTDKQEERILLAHIKLKLSITAGINLWAAVPGSDVRLQRFSNDDECLGWTCSAESFYANQVAQSGAVSALIFSCWEKIYVFVSLKHTNRQNQRPLSSGIPRYRSAQHRIPERSMVLDCDTLGLSIVYLLTLNEYIRLSIFQ